MSPQYREKDEDFNLPWCNAIFNDPSFSPLPYPSCILPPPSANSTQSFLFGHTLFTDDTIRACAAFYKKAMDDPDHVAEAGEVRMLLSLGSALDGHASVLHGGIIALIMDEVTGFLVYKTYNSGNIYTVSLASTMHKPIHTPCLVLGRAWIERAPERRRVWVKFVLEDEKRNAYASGETLFIRSAEVKL